jgi:hypothetical protein
VLATAELGDVRVTGGVVTSALIGVAAVRTELELGIQHSITTNLSVGVAGGPAATWARDDDNTWGWSAAISLERSSR